MAGPGGGPSRRSHTKSRKGCKTCKRRHIRCDEVFPQCRNCTKHHVRCDYMDSSASGTGDEKSPEPDTSLPWSADVEKTVNLWRQTGEFPFPELSIDPQPVWTALSKTELRLVHHVARICAENARNATSKMLVWAELMPKFFSAAVPYPFVMQSILSFSASHLAWAAQSDETRTLSSHYRTLALQGLHEAIGSFSKAKADAVFAGSMLLSWQATDWRNWASLMTGVSTVMQSYRSDSIFEDYLAAHSLEPFKNFTEISSVSSPQTGLNERAATLQHAYGAIEQLQCQLLPGSQGHRWLEQLKGFARRLQTSPPAETAEQEVNQLYPLRKWLFWAPVALLVSRQDQHLMPVVLAHFYAVALAIEPMFPTIGADFCANMALAPLEEILRMIAQEGTTSGHDSSTLQRQPLMAFPKEAAAHYRARINWPARQPLLHCFQQEQTQTLVLDSLNLQLNLDVSEQDPYSGLSPPFALSPSRKSSSSGPVASASGDSQASYLELPHMALPAMDASEHPHSYPGATLFSASFGAPMLQSTHGPDPFGELALPPEEQVFFDGMGAAGSWQSGCVYNPHQPVWA